MRDQVLSDYYGIPIESYTGVAADRWKYQAACGTCHKLLCEIVVHNTFWEDALKARSRMCHSILKEIDRNKCECCDRWQGDS